MEHPEGDVVFRHACKMGLEGIVSKAPGVALDRSGRSPDWFKSRTLRRLQSGGRRRRIRASEAVLRNHQDNSGVLQNARRPKRQEAAMKNKKGVLLGPRRGNQKRFPYEPRLVRGQDADAGRTAIPSLLPFSERGDRSDIGRIAPVVEQVRPELAGKLPAARSGAGHGLS